jgi:uncharacterized membrane protein SirB2
LPFRLTYYYAFIRDSVAKFFPIYFYIWLGYAFLSGVPMTLIPFKAYETAIVPGGKTDGSLASGFVIFSGLIAVHHIQFGISIRNWTWLMAILFFVSVFLYFPVSVFRNERS